MPLDSSSRGVPVATSAGLRLAVAAVLCLCSALLSPGARAQSSDAGVVRPGDRIAVRILADAVVADSFTVDDEFDVNDEGEVVLPKLGPVAVAGIPVGSVRSRIRTEYADYLRTRSIEVTVLRRIGVHGEVKEPGVFWVDPTVMLREVVAMAGGLTNEGDPDEIHIIREGERLSARGSDTAALLGVELRSGDQVVVGRRNWFSLNTPYVISTGISVFSILAGILLAR